MYAAPIRWFVLVLLLVWWLPATAAFPLLNTSAGIHQSHADRKNEATQNADATPHKPIDRKRALIYAVVSVAFGSWFLGGMARRYLGYRTAGILQLLGPPMLFAGAVCLWMGWWLPAILLFAWAAAMQVWMVTDLVRIVLNRLKPTNGRYYVVKQQAVPPAF